MPATRPFIVGITGGIASGKSTVCDCFARRGVPVVDADLIARELVAPGSEMLATIAAHFGRDILQDDGSLDRKALRARIFDNPEEKAWLESRLHPPIRETIKARCMAAEAPWVLLAIPLLLENGGYDFIDRVLVVDLPEDTQWQRGLARDGNEQTLQAIIDSQVDRSTRLSRADDIIDNSGSLNTLEAEVERLNAFYRQQAQHQNSQLSQLR